ncbi:MAG: SDR family oxidoreductase [Acidobacteriota bacterium]|nr:SDR family oxidoreductase [Acidobacteriota bacterium]
MNKSLVVITGASSGIGATFARRLARTNDLLLIARRKDKLDALAAELMASSPSNVEVLAADLTVEADLEKVAERIQNEPELGLLINNAGFGSKGRFWEIPFKIHADMNKLHVTAVTRLTHAALRNMVGRDFGSIINVASVAAFLRSPGSASYCASKTWMTALTETVYLELKGMGSNVGIQSLCPGFTYSEFHDKMGVERQRLAPRSFWLSADEIVDASLYGLKRGKLFVIPNWRYRTLTSIASKLPTSIRLFLEGAGGRVQRRMLSATAVHKQVGDSSSKGRDSR